MNNRLSLTLVFTYIVALQPVMAHQAVDKSVLEMIEPGSVALTDVPMTKAQRIEKGRDIFLNETFGGNGRTCGTCHEPTRNFTIDSKFISTLPKSSPLFVAERVKALEELENPVLMRKFGLILENLDGFGKPGVMRGVPHTLGLSLSIEPAIDHPVQGGALGWSGDGSPGNGSLRQFAIGAVVQHFPKTLKRIVGEDFRLPTQQELNVMEDFQLSLGRKKGINLQGDESGGGSDALVFADPIVESGKALFIEAPGRGGTVKSCNACHDEGGATDENGVNRQFDTGVAMDPRAPMCRDTTGRAPGDGGLGSEPQALVPIDVICDRIPKNAPDRVTFLGDGTFNVPSVIEAADTGPFFHNNLVNTIEQAVAFYNTDTFNDSPGAFGSAFLLDRAQIEEIGALLRTINAMENIRNGIVLDRRGKSEGQDIIREARAETRDAIRVLTGSPVDIYDDTDIVPLLRKAEAAETKAIAGDVAQLEVAIAHKKSVSRKFLR